LRQLQRNGIDAGELRHAWSGSGDAAPIATAKHAPSPTLGARRCTTSTV